MGKKNAITDVWLTASVKKLPTLAPPCCVKKCSISISLYYAINYIYIVKGCELAGTYCINLSASLSLNVSGYMNITACTSLLRSPSRVKI